MTYEEILQVKPELPLFIYLTILVASIIGGVSFVRFIYKTYSYKSSEEHFFSIMSSIALPLVLMVLGIMIADMFFSPFVKNWEDEQLIPFLEEHVETKESEDFDIVDYDHDTHEAKIHFILDNGETAVGELTLDFNLEKGEKANVTYKCNDKYFKHVSDSKIHDYEEGKKNNSFYSFDENFKMNSAWYKDQARQDYYFGVYDVELHASKKDVEDFPIK